MKKRLSLPEYLMLFERRRVITWIDTIKVSHIFFIWIAIILLFGFIYHFFSGSSGILYSTILKQPIYTLRDAIYFSFITATSTGFGDIVPQGIFSIMAIIEVTLGLLLLALVTSKLVALKQNLILGEVYEISFTEKVNRLRSGLLLFRQHIRKMVSRVRANQVQAWELHDIYLYVHSFETILEEIIPLVRSTKKHQFAKMLDAVNAELLVNSVHQSFRRVEELVGVLRGSSLEWKRPITIKTMQSCVSLTRKLFLGIEHSALGNNTDIATVRREVESIIVEIEKDL